MLSVLPKTRVLSRSYATSFNFHEMVQGNRDQVGWGSNGLPYYFDCPLVPFPAVRYKLNTPEVLALREKEKGDWCKLSMDEKTQLYRNSFRHSYAEILAPKGKWGLVFGCVFLFMSTVFWVYLIVRLGISMYRFFKKKVIAQFDFLRILEINKDSNRRFC